MIDPSVPPFWLIGDFSMENVKTLANLSEFFTYGGIPRLRYAVEEINV